MPANKFVLKGGGVEIDYTIGANPSFPALTFTHGAFQKSFKPSELLSENTGLGELVSFSLILTIDTGGERFGVFLPFVEPPQGKAVLIHTVGVYETFSGPNSIPRRPSVWRCLDLSGTAQSVIVPL